MKMRFRVAMLLVAAAICSPSLQLSAQTVSHIRVAQWNVEDGEQAGEINAIVNQHPDIVFLQEIDRPGHLDEIIAALETNQGVNWDPPQYISRYNSMSGASWVAILSKYPMSNVHTKLLNGDGENLCGVTTTQARAAIGATIFVDGKQLAIFSTRNFWYSGDCPAKEDNLRFRQWADANYPNMTHLVGGDFNMQPGGIAYDVMTTAPAYTDAWAEAVTGGTATSFDGSPNFYTPTKNSRLDYQFYRNAATVLSTDSAEIPAGDTTLSDHRMMIATYSVTSGGSDTFTKDILATDDVFIRGGSWANTNLNDPATYPYVATRASANDEYRRRVLLKFDTTTTNIPAGATIVSAKLYVTLKYTNTQSRTVSAYDVTESGWVESTVTWNNRTPTSPWISPGATLGGVRGTALIGTTVGVTSEFDVTAWVQTVVNGQQPGGSRWTRLALVDEDTNGTSETYKEFHSEEANVDRSMKPRLVVIYR